MTSQLTIELASQLVNSQDEFPVNFDELWQWCGYTRKDSAKERLVRNFDEGIDYIVRNGSDLMAELNSHIDYTPQEKARFNSTMFYWLSVTAAKEFAMLAQTEQGKEVRKYFIAAEEQCRKMLNESNQSNQILEIVKNLASNLEKQKQELCEIKEQNQLLLADKSQNEELGIEVIENFPKIPELLDYLKFGFKTPSFSS